MRTMPWLVVLAGLFISVDIWAFQQINHLPGTPGSVSFATAQASAAEPAQTAAYANANVSASAAAAVTTSEIRLTQPVEESGPSGAESLMKLDRVNGVSIADDLKTIYEIKGEPISKQRDDVLRLSQVYSYKDCSIGLVDGAIQYVVVPASAGTIDIDGQIIPIDLAKLGEKLGTPYFISEDGIVYKNRNHALKIFLDPDTGEIDNIHYFHAAAE
ncbi:hypothetical protein ACHHV8_29340 [Paenibacillus sp. TAB 01]|uniref:hypothetical protein n=1 Tax=Paenibacillus sp. TAB 01 TaxID=3368988 RepID=UPI00374FFF77